MTLARLSDAALRADLARLRAEYDRALADPLGDARDQARRLRRLGLKIGRRWRELETRARIRELAERSG